MKFIRKQYAGNHTLIQFNYEIYISMMAVAVFYIVLPRDTKYLSGMYYTDGKNAIRNY